MGQIKADTITNEAGSGAPSLPYGIQIGTTRSEIWVNIGNGYGSINTSIRRFTTIVRNNGSDVTLTQSSTLGDSFTINATGIYAITYSDQSGGTVQMGVTINGTNHTTDYNSLTMAQGFIYRIGSVAGQPGVWNLTTVLSIGDVIRPFNGGDSTNKDCSFRIVRIS